MTEIFAGLILAFFAGVLIMTGQLLGAIACAGPAMIFGGSKLFGGDGSGEA